MGVKDLSILFLQPFSGEGRLRLTFPPKTAHLYWKIIIAFLEAVFLKSVSKNYLDDGIKSTALSLCPVSHPQEDFVWKNLPSFFFFLHTQLRGLKSMRNDLCSTGMLRQTYLTDEIGSATLSVL